MRLQRVAHGFSRGRFRITNLFFTSLIVAIAQLAL